MISIIVGIQEKDRGIGFEGKLPWHIPADLHRFKVLTSGHPIIMGRKTFDSIGRPLPNRTNIVISREPQEVAGVTFVRSLVDAIEHAKTCEGAEEIFVIGGSSIYEGALPVADKLYLTLIEGNFLVDTYFPEYTKYFPIEAERESHTEGNTVFHFTVRSK